MPVETPSSQQTERCGESTLETAKAGDERAFQELVTPHLRELHVHCYRMLGSVVDAEDLLQETLAAAWSALDGFAGRSSLRGWLYRIATNRCLNAIRDAKRRPAREPVPPFTPPEPSRRGDVTWLQPYPDAWLERAPDRSPGPEASYQTREAIELAFIVALQRLPPRQAAALLLCDVLDFSIAEVAKMLYTGPTAVKGLLQRARRSLKGQRGASFAGEDAPSGGAQDQVIAQQFAAAFIANDLDALVSLLTDDAWLAMPPAPHEYHGPDAIAAFLRASAAWRGRRKVQLVPSRANAQLAFGNYHERPDGAVFDAVGILVLTLGNDRIVGITHFLDSGLPRVFALPDTLEP